MDVGRDLGAAAGEEEAERAHPGQAAAGLAQPRGDGAGDLDVAAVELDVEGGQRRARGDQGGAAAPVRQRRPEVGPQPPQPPSAARARRGRRCGSRRARCAPGRAPALRRGRRGRRCRRSGSATATASARAGARGRRGRSRPPGRRRGRRPRGGRRCSGTCRSARPPRAAPASSALEQAAARVLGEGEDGAVVVGVGVAVEERRRRGRRRPRAPSSSSPVAPLGDVGDGEQGRHHRQMTTSSPPLTIASPSISTVGSSTTQSRWTGTWTVPPIAAEAPKATWQVPRIFSSSRMLPVRIASSLVPIPSSATLVPSSPCGASAAPAASAPSEPVASVRCPSRTVSETGVSSRPTPAIEPSTTSVPSAVPSSGAMKPSPQGRLPKAPRLLRSPASAIAMRPSRPRRRSLPWRQVIRASEPLFSAATTAQPRRRSSSRSARHQPRRACPR